MNDVRHDRKPTRAARGRVGIPTPAAIGAAAIGAAVLALIVAMAPAVRAADAAAAQSPESIGAAAEAAVRERVRAPERARIELNARAPDDRLRLSRCPEPLRAEPAAGDRPGARRLVTVACPAPDGWRLHVPVQVAIWAPVVVTTRPLRRGRSLAADDLALEERDVAARPGAYGFDVAALLGRTLRSGVGMGQPLNERQLAPILLVSSGEKVVLASGGTGLEVLVSGIALNDGREGQRVRVRNLSTEQIVSGVVTERGRVRVGP